LVPNCEHECRSGVGVRLTTNRGAVQRSLAAIAFALLSACSSTVRPLDGTVDVSDAASQVGTGELYVRQVEPGFIGMGIGMSMPGWSLSGFFVPPGGLNLDSVVGPCRARDVQQIVHHGAGDISVTTGGSTYVQPDAGILSVAGMNLPAGASVVISAPGATVPAFDATLVVQPDIQLLSPIVTQSGVLRIDSSMGATFSWSGAPRFVVIEFYGTATPIQYVRCTFPGAGGSATVPGGALGPLMGSPGGLVEVYSADVASVPLSGWSIDVYMENEAARSLISVR
jgi:hypothetical protein